MVHRCEQCNREFSRRIALQNHIKTHNSELDRILHEISKESNQEVENTDEESGREGGEEMIIIEDNQESEGEVNYED